MHDIKIENFRCYEHKTMEFRPGINLLIGDNSVGKTSLLRACNLVINSFFSGYSDENTTWKSAEDDDFREVSSAETVLGKDLPVCISFHLNERDLPQIVAADKSVHGIDHTQEFVIEKMSKKSSRNRVTGLRNLKEYAALLQENSVVLEDGKAVQLNALPVYAYFTTEDIHTVRKFDREKKRFKKYPQKPSFGYFENFDSKGLLDCWLKRLLVLKEGNKGAEEINNVRGAIQTAFGADGCNIISDIEIRPNIGEVVFVQSDGREVKSDLLSDGYRRLVSIVIDVAMRCSLLNKTMCGDEAYKHTHGCVIVDEIDEHLHPAIQLRILKALRKTFPKIQFIVSSHSPLVISSVEKSPENVVYKLMYNSEDKVYEHMEVNAYGLDASTIISVWMNQSARDIDVKKELDDVQTLIDGADYEPAKEKLHKLMAELNTNDPEFARLETAIAFLE